MKTGYEQVSNKKLHAFSTSIQQKLQKSAAFADLYWGPVTGLIMFVATCARDWWLAKQ